MTKSYDDFREVENEIREATKASPIVYKYRNWEIENHRKIVQERVAWFAHPFDLNDPHDLRPPYNFLADNIDWDQFKEHLFIIGKEKGIHANQLQNEVEFRLKKAKADPVKYFQENRGIELKDRSHFDPIGVFSCCLSGLNEPMWAHYGNNHNGFAIGFDTVGLCRALNCGVGYVNYSDASIDYHILGDNKEGMDKEIFQKSTKWASEEEFRFITFGIDRYRIRKEIFPAEVVKEILFGINTDSKVQVEIVNAAKAIFPGITFYKVEPNMDSYGFQKTELK